MTETSIIRIEEQKNPSAEDQPYTASVSFNHGVRYPCQIRDPFADEVQQEKEWEWYSELVKGQTLVLLGSRSAEDWLAKGTFDDNRYDLPGLDPEAATLLTERILERHKVTHYREDPDLRKIIKVLDVFPLALEVVLANLVQQTPTQVFTALQTGDIALKAGESDKRTENILRCIDYSHSNLSPEAQQLLLCLTPFTSVVALGPLLDSYVTQLKQQPALADLPFDRLSDVIQEAVKWGLLSPKPDDSRFSCLQPVLPYFLRNRSSGAEQQQRRSAVEKAFQDHYQNLSKLLYAYITSKEAKKQQIGLLVTQFEYENLLTALRFTLREKTSVIDLYTVLSHYLDRLHDHQRGEELDALVLVYFETLSQEDLTGSPGVEFVPILGTIANRQKDLKQYEAATKSYHKILQMLKTDALEMKHHRLWQANTYHNLGGIALNQHRWQEAEGYCQQTLQIYMENDDHYGQAHVYQQLGIIAQEQRKWQEAEGYCQQALQITVQYNDRYEQAKTYHQLGRISQEQRNWQKSEDYFKYALNIYIEYEKLHGQKEDLLCG